MVKNCVKEVIYTYYSQISLWEVLLVQPYCDTYLLGFITAQIGKPIPDAFNALCFQPNNPLIGVCDCLFTMPEVNHGAKIATKLSG